MSFGKMTQIGRQIDKHEVKQTTHILKGLLSLFVYVHFSVRSPISKLATQASMSKLKRISIAQLLKK